MVSAVPHDGQPRKRFNKPTPMSPLKSKNGAREAASLQKEEQIKAAHAAYNALPAALQYQVSNYAVLVAAEAALQELKDSFGGGGAVDNTITVSMRLIGAELAEEDVDLGKAELMPDYVTWIATTRYEMDKGQHSL